MANPTSSTTQHGAYLPSGHPAHSQILTTTAGHANTVVGLWAHSKVIRNDERIPKGEETTAMTHTKETQGNWDWSDNAAHGASEGEPQSWLVSFLVLLIID